MSSAALRTGVLVWAVLTACGQSPRDMGSAEWHDVTIPVGGRDSLHVVYRGIQRSHVLVFIPGLADTWSSYQQLVDALPDTFGIVLFDALGHGGSTKHAGTSNPAHQSAAIKAALDSLGVRPFAVIGHSYGGVIAQHFGTRYPDLPAAILMNTGATLRGHPAAGDWEVFAREMPDSVPDEALAGQAESFYKPVPDSVVAPYIAASRKTPGHVWREAINAMLAEDTRPELASWRPRTLLVMSEADKVIGDYTMLQLASTLRGADTIRVPRTSHAPHWERPDTVAAVIAAFLDRVVQR